MWSSFIVMMVACLVHAGFGHSLDINSWLDAAVKGDSGKISRLLAEEPGLLNAQDPQTGRTALIEAALNGQTEVVETLMNLGAEVEKLNEAQGGFTAFDAAIHSGNLAIVKLLIDKVDPNVVTPKDGLRPIHRASSGTHGGFVEILKLLLKTDKVSANDKSIESLTPIGYAVRSMRPTQFRKAERHTSSVLGFKRDIVRVLLDHGADASELTDDDITGLGLSFREVEQYKTRPVAKRKIPHFRHNTSPDERMLEAVQRSDWEWVQMEITENKANVNAVQKGNGQTAFMTACLKGDVATAKKLYELGADVTFGESKGYTPIHGAGFQGHADIAKFLIEETGVDPNDLHEDGYRPIHRACWGKQPRHAEFVRYLLSTGRVDPDSKTTTGQTPLQVLVSHEYYRNPATAKVLAQFGADVSVLKEEQIELLQLVSDDDFSSCPAHVMKTK